MPPCIAVDDPDLIKDILAMRPDEYRSDVQAIPVSIGKHSVLFQDGERHLRQRKVLTPPLHGPRLRGYADQIAAITDATIDRWEAGHRIRLYPHVQELALTVFLRCVFGVGADDEHELRRLALRWASIALSPWLSVASLAIAGIHLRRLLDRESERSLARESGALDLRPWRALGDRKADLVRFLRAQVEACRRRGTGDRTDVLALLLDARYDDGSPLETDEIVDQLVTMIVAGYETTAHTLCWTLQHVFADASVRARARDESAGLEPAALAEQPYLDACVRESMRITPVAPVFARALARERRLGRWSLPSTCTLWADIYSVQHRAELWPEPDRFVPTRMLGETPSPHTFFPFGGGRRRCLGAAFASYEMRVALGRILARVDLEVPRESRARFRGFSVSPAGDLPATVLDVRARA
jgi:cytochrome P450